MSSTWPARLDAPARGHERSRSREARRATVAPQSTPLQGGYRPPESGSPRTRNQSICRQIRPNSFLRGWLRIPVAVLIKALLTRGFFVSSGPFTDQFRESGPARGRSLTRYRTLLEDCLAPVARSSNGRANRVRERVRRWLRAPGGRSVNYARRQQYRRLSHAGKAALGSAVTALLGLAVARAGAAPLAGRLLLTAVGLGLYARHWLSLARRSRVGARSEDEVQRALAHLHFR
jgi:hypothetical protein